MSKSAESKPAAGCGVETTQTIVADRGFKRVIPVALTAMAAVLLLLSLKLPLWQMRLEAPQYQDQ